jgi:hypothetical protein
MNLDAQDMEFIKTSVKAALSDSDLVKKEDFNLFRAEVLAAQQQFIQREVFELRIKTVTEEIDKLWEASTANKNVLASIWETALGKAITVGLGLLTLVQVWQLMHP